MSDELKPCPFCGDEARRYTLGPDEYGNEGGDVIECTGCGASSHVEFGFKENLVSVWNARASDAAIRAAHAEIERLRQEAIDLTEAIIDWYTKPSRKTCDILEEFARAALQETDK